MSIEHTQQMAEFDSLPKAIRQKLANANMNYSSRDIKELYKTYGQGNTMKIIDQEERKHSCPLK